MEEEPKDVMVLGAIKSGAKTFDKIRKATRIDPKELNEILERLERRELITVQKKKGFFGPKIEMQVTDKGKSELESRIHELEQDWNKMVTLYKSSDKQKLEQMMDDRKSLLPTMMFFGIIDMIMFTAMFSMIGHAMSQYVPPEQMSEGTEGTDGSEMGDSGMGDGGGFDIDVGF
jgi:DNA-binding HxlR family transcriptional regulator